MWYFSASTKHISQMKSFLFLCLSALFIVSCSNSTDNSIQTKVKALMENNQYTEALQVISNAPASEETTALAKEIRVANGTYLMKKIADLKTGTDSKALAKAHIELGIFLEYYGEHLPMRERMTNSLAHFRRALQLDPSNEKAVAEIGQIEGIYTQMGREVPQDIAE